MDVIPFELSQNEINNFARCFETWISFEKYQNTLEFLRTYVSDEIAFFSLQSIS